MKVKGLSLMELCDLYADRRATEGPQSATAAMAKIELERRETVMLDLISGAVADPRSEEAKMEAKAT